MTLKSRVSSRQNIKTQNISMSMSSKSKSCLVIECNTLTAEEGASPPLAKSEEEEDEGRWAKSLAFDGHEKGGLFVFFFKFYRLIERRWQRTQTETFQENYSPEKKLVHCLRRTIPHQPPLTWWDRNRCPRNHLRQPKNLRRNPEEEEDNFNFEKKPHKEIERDREFYCPGNRHLSLWLSKPDDDVGEK